MQKALIIFSLIFWGCNQSSSQKEELSKPNIILIMSDDMGYSDIEPYGSEIKTPALNKLAENGIRFTQFYNAARCCPTRASLLTGLYPHQAGMGWMTGIETNYPAYQGDLNQQCVTIAEVAKTAGYATFMTGKWHVSKNVREEGSKHNWPLQRGFDRYYGTIQGAGNFYDPAALCRDNTLITPLIDSLYPAQNYYYTDAISDEAIRFVQERKKDKPFFMYMAYTAAHWPMHAKAEDIAKYKGKYDKGWEVLRKERLERMKKIGVISADTDLSPLDVHSWEDEEWREIKSGRMEVYAAMIDAMDQGIGRLCDFLEAEGIIQNTVILFLQDNGGCAEEIGTEGKNRYWAESENELIPLKKSEVEYNVIPRVTRLGKPIYRGQEIIGGPDTTYVAYGKVWAHASNTPFKEYKHWVHEGGIATPLIIHYPNGILHPNSISSAPSHLIDIMPTLVQLMSANYPAKYNGNMITPMEGQSLLPIISGNEDAFDRSRIICWEHEMNRAVRKGPWKLVSKAELLNGPYGKWKNFKHGEWELYNLDKDRSELNNVADSYPEVMEELIKAWNNYAKKIDVYPAPWTEIKL